MQLFDPVITPLCIVGIFHCPPLPFDLSSQTGMKEARKTHARRARKTSASSGFSDKCATETQFIICLALLGSWLYQLTLWVFGWVHLIWIGDHYFELFTDPESDRCLPLPVIYYDLKSHLFRRLDWCDSGWWWRLLVLKSCWYCCWCWQ